MKTIVSILLLAILTSCANYKDVPYFQNTAEYDGTGKEVLYDMTIKPKDELTIFVFSSSDPASVAQFNFVEPSSIANARHTTTGIDLSGSNRRRHGAPGFFRGRPPQTMHDSISKGVDLCFCQKCCTFAPYSIKV